MSRFVYLIHNQVDDTYKIGISNNPDKRLYYINRELNVYKGLKILNTWEGCFEDEQKLHKIFGNQCVGGEWFNLFPNDLEYINKYFECKEFKAKKREKISMRLSLPKYISDWYMKQAKALGITKAQFLENVLIGHARKIQKKLKVYHKVLNND